MLRETCQVHDGSRPGASREARLFHGIDARLESQVRLDLRMIYAHSRRSGRTYDLNGDRSDASVQSVRTEYPRRAHAVLGAARNHAHGGIDYPDVRVNTHRHREIGLAIAPIA